MVFDFSELVCPSCGGRAIGKVGTDQFYCWDCCVEFLLDDDEIEVFEVDPDGDLVSIGRKGFQEGVSPRFGSEILPGDLAART